MAAALTAVMAGLALMLTLAALPAQAHPRGSAVLSSRFGSPVELRLPGGSAYRPAQTLYGLACASPGDCVAGVTYVGGHHRVLVGVLTQRHGIWGQVEPIRLPPGATGLAEPQINGIACPRAGDCVAVGGYLTSAGSGLAFLATQTSGRWDRARQPLLPADAATQPDAGLYGISCTAPGWCEAVGTYTDSAQLTEAIVVTESGGHWQRAVSVAMPPDAAADPGGLLDGIACWSAGNCAAIGQYELPGGVTVAAAVTQSDGRWGRVIQLAAPVRGSAVSYASLLFVSCTHVGWCTATGSYEASRSFEAMTVSRGPAGWGRALPLRAVPRHSYTSDLNGVACPARGQCVAVGWAARQAGPARSLAVAGAGARWHQIGAGGGPAGDSGRITILTNVSCPGRGYCEGIGFYLDRAGQYEAFAVTMG